MRSRGKETIGLIFVRADRRGRLLSSPEERASLVPDGRPEIRRWVEKGTSNEHQKNKKQALEKEKELTSRWEKRGKEFHTREDLRESRKRRENILCRREEKHGGGLESI